MSMVEYLEQGEEGSSWESNGVHAVKDQPAESDSRMARLVRTIEGEIVPRLVLSRRVVPTTSMVKVRATKSPNSSDIHELVRLLLAHDAGVASAYVEAVRHGGISLETICLQLLAPAARELGVLWEADECDFMQVTVGLCRLHQVLRQLSSEFRAVEYEAHAERRILLTPVPGDQHTFGITLVAQFLRRAGWEVWHEFPNRHTDIIEVLRHHWFTVIGLSVGTESRLDAVAALISSIRHSSRNRSVGVLVGGPLLVDQPELAGLVGADATAADGNEAVLKAQQMCDRRAARAGSN